MIFIGIDNGVSGSIGIVKDNGKSRFYKTPCFMQQSYTKAKQNISRINHRELRKILRMYARQGTKIFLERPMVNPGRFKATASALRALEATLVVIERLGIPHEYIDSKEWQRVVLPDGTKSPPELKKASADIGCRLFPKHRELIHKHGDADGLLIAEYCRRADK